MADGRRWRGLVSLLGEAVVQGSVSIERVQRDSAMLPFAVFEAMPTVGALASGVHAVHDLAVVGTHQSIRGVTRAVVKVAALAFDAVEPPRAPDAVR